MKPAGKLTTLALLAALALGTGCGSFRGLPAHGGGKRFDEEERAVAGAIRQACAAMNLAELRNRKVRVLVNTLEHSGSGSADYPGLSSVGLNTSLSRTVYDNARDLYREFGEQPKQDVWRPQYRDDNELNSLTRGGDLRYDTKMRYSSHPQRSDRDSNYLTEVLHMRIRHLGGWIVNENADVVLVVLVDVLGTNVGRDEYILFRRDRLTASCEMSYYGLDVPKGSRLLFPVRRVAAQADYSESGVFGLTGVRVNRSLAMVDPYPLPLDCPLSPDGEDGAGGVTNGLSHSAGEPEVETADSLESAIGVMIDLRQAEQARRLLDALRRLAPQNPEIARLAARIAEIEKQPSRAPAAADPAAESAAAMKKTVANLLNYAETRIQSQKPGDARQVLETIRVMDPGNPDLIRLETQLQRLEVPAPPAP